MRLALTVDRLLAGDRAGLGGGAPYQAVTAVLDDLEIWDEETRDAVRELIRFADLGRADAAESRREKKRPADDDGDEDD